jgi:hypothetical protein
VPFLRSAHTHHAAETEAHGNLSQPG